MFSIRTFLHELQAIVRRAGQQVTYAALLLYHAFSEEGTPFWARNIIFGALAYLIAPIDTIPDLTPVLGYTDDLGVLSFGLVNIAAYINDNVRIKARKGVLRMFSSLDLPALQKVDARL